MLKLMSYSLSQSHAGEQSHVLPGTSCNSHSSIVLYRHLKQAITNHYKCLPTVMTYKLLSHTLKGRETAFVSVVWTITQALFQLCWSQGRPNDRAGRSIILHPCSSFPSSHNLSTADTILFPAGHDLRLTAARSIWNFPFLGTFYSIPKEVQRKRSLNCVLRH